MNPSFSSESISPPPKATLWRGPFILTCLAALAFFISYHMLTPAFPLYLHQSTDLIGIGHSPAWLLGLILSLFIVASLLLRPWVGRWCDATGPRRWMLWGAVLFSGAPLLYPLTLHTPWLFVARILHGAGLALFYTAASTMVSQLIPAQRRAEGMSHFGNAIKLAMAFGPALGLWLATQQQFNTLFWAVSGISLLAAGLVWNLPNRSVSSSSKAVPKPAHGLFHTKALFPGLAMASNSVVFGALIPFIPLMTGERHWEQTLQWFYPVYAISLILSRGLTGPLSDRYGRNSIILPGMLGVTLTVLTMALATHETLFLITTALYGVFAGTVQPSLMALVADRIPAEERGTGMATFTLLNDLGVGTGTFLTAVVGQTMGYTVALMVIGGITLMGALYYMMTAHQEKQMTMAGGSF